jgi:ribosomal protein L29
VAASLIFAAGLWLGVLRGNAPTASRDVATGGAVPAAGATMATTSELAALERRLRTEMAQLRTTAASSGAAAPASASETQLLARVRTLIEESEQRQQRELALRTAQVFREFDSQRQMDLAQIQRSFGQIEGLTGRVRERQLAELYLMRVSNSVGVFVVGGPSQVHPGEGEPVVRRWVVAVAVVSAWPAAWAQVPPQNADAEQVKARQRIFAR